MKNIFEKRKFEVIGTSITYSFTDQHLTIHNSGSPYMSTYKVYEENEKTYLRTEQPLQSEDLLIEEHGNKITLSLKYSQRPYVTLREVAT